MYSSRLLKILHLQVRWSYFWGACPFTFTRKQRTVHVTLIGRCHLAFILGIILVFTLLFLPQQIYRYRKPEYLKEFNFAVFVWLLSLLGDLMFIFIFLEADTFCYIINATLRLAENFGGNSINCKKNA